MLVVGCYAVDSSKRKDVISTSTVRKVEVLFANSRFNSNTSLPVLSSALACVLASWNSASYLNNALLGGFSGFHTQRTWRNVGLNLASQRDDEVHGYWSRAPRRGVNPLPGKFLLETRALVPNEFKQLLARFIPVSPFCTHCL